MNDVTASETAAPELRLLSAIEARILGGLIEKEATTPDAYPLTANAVVLACNQKNNREPVLELEVGEVGHALRDMERKGLLASIHGARAQRYEHRFAKNYSLTQKQQAVLSIMLLRGPQTVAELLTRCERIATFADHDDVRQTLERLQQRAPVVVINLGRASGQREDRYMHLLCGEVSLSDYAVSEDSSAPRRAALEARVEALETEIAALRNELEALRNRD